MAVAIFEIPKTPTRLLKPKEAAIYCRLPERQFPALCPVTPLDLGNGVRLYDINDLDQWIDSMKGDPKTIEDDAIIGRIG
ncbi:hypothetical protein [Bartonella sp. DGB2]|uniref:hypothetical protein n=1 Tax=Bartonella sp. DGB2 TaxID=3388426 RepID=UPI00398FE43E